MASLSAPPSRPPTAEELDAGVRQSARVLDRGHEKARFFGRPWAIVCLGGMFLGFVNLLPLLAVFGSLLLFCLTREKMYGYLFLSALPIYGITRAVRHVSLSKVTCPLCHGPVILQKRCRKHVRSHKIPLLSHRLSCLVDICLKGVFNCMYCGTKFRVRK